jgi:hypothetical protein
MEFKDNFSETHMLFNQPVTFTIYADNRDVLTTFQMKLPTFQMFYFEDTMKQFVSLIHTPITDLQDQFIMVKNFESHYQLLACLMLLQNPRINKYLDVVKNALALLDLQIEFIPSLGGIMVNGIRATEELLTRIFRIILISLALKKQSDFIDDPQMRLYQEKIDRIKRKNKPAKGAESGDFQQAYMILTYEFGYKPEEILNMTQYAINTILGYTNKSITYKLTLIAAANGNTKKVKFITDKGK